MAPERRTSDFRFKTRYTVLTPNDGDRFSRMLRRAFPSIRFTRRYASDYSLRELNPDLTMASFRRLKFEPPDLHVPYVETMGVADGDTFTAWIEPEGWDPFWLGPNERDHHWIVNEPELSFNLRTCGARQAATRADEGALELCVERIEASYYLDQPEKKRFLDKVWRILAKMTTNKLLRVHWETREPLAPEPDTEHCWAGPDAIRWALEHPLRTFDEDLRPAGPLEVPEFD